VYRGKWIKTRQHYYVLTPLAPVPLPTPRAGSHNTQLGEEAELRGQAATQLVERKAPANERGTGWAWDVEVLRQVAI